MKHDSNPNYMEAVEARHVEGEGRPHVDKGAQYSHEMSQESSEASGRLIVRTVPVLYGVLVGGILGNFPAGILTGLLVSIALDLTMRDKSLFRPLLRPGFMVGCPLVSAAARTLAGGLGRAGLRVPAALRDMRCGA